MSTSLAEQLKRLTVPQTTVLKRDKKRASLLFDAKEAAGLKRETVFQIGLEGLEELISKNEIFDEYRNSLFHITSRDFERSVQDTETNKKLDKTLRKFLLLLSPYFLLNCTHKVLEWLINRYSVNEYNREDLLMLILPYHESNIFVRVLQLLQFKDSNDSFYFLKTLQKPGVHLPKQSLLNTAANNSGFLKFVTKYIMMLIKFHEKPNLLTVAFNFYCSVFAGAIEYSEEVTEDQVSQILPLLLKGLNSHISDFCAASYVVTARLVAKANLSNILLDKFVEKISSIKVAGLKTEACLVLLVVYQSQKQYCNVPHKAVANLSEIEWLPKVLEDLNTSGSYILPFLEKLVKRCTEEGINNDLELARDLVKKILDVVKLEDSYTAIVLRSVLDSVRPKVKYSVEIKNWLTEIIQTLERQYPNAFDKEVLRILSSTQDKNMIKKKKCLSKILKNTMTYKGKFDVFEKLYHPNPQFRGEAIKYLLENYNSLKETDKEIIKNSFIDRLNDENVNVVQGTLLIIQKTSVLKKEDLKNILVTLTNKCFKNKREWGNISNSVLKILCSNSDVGDWQVLLAVFPFLLPESSEELTFSKKLIKLPFISEHILFKPFSEKLRSATQAQDFVKIVLKCLQSNNTWDIVREFLEMLKKIPNEKRDSYHKYVASVILTNILPRNSPIDVSTLVLEILVTYYDVSKAISNAEKASVVDYIRTATSDKFPTPGYLKCLENVIKKTKTPLLNLGLTDFSGDNSDKKYFVLLSNVLMNKNHLYRKSLVVYLNHFCVDWLSKVDFLLNLCISENKCLDTNFKKETLNYLLQNLKALERDEVKQYIYIEKPTSTYLLILLSDPEEKVRKVTFEIIELFTNVSTRYSHSYYYLFEVLRKHKEEIIMDHEQVPLILFNLIDPSSAKGKRYANDLNSIRKNLLKLACNEVTPIYLKAGLLKSLSHVNTFDMLEETAKLALDILLQNSEVIDKFKAIVIGKVINRIDSKTIGKVNFDTNTWKLIEYSIKNDKTVILDAEYDKICPAALMLNQLEKEFFWFLMKQL
ncbi:hypothetical protein NQ314_018104 [Rhamnusium bicolor]|uniref:HEAT repeat-containing protein 1 n=1 Tax=Rhamnusium bicolor TaxID=1586634 RepID=A0AAV8WT75_9CUCU|nr:hypothetical protein NQ314_018104 [Rhamnusium bicolor]